MRIAYVINSLEGGGAALPVPSVASVLRDHGADVRIFALTPRDRRAEAAMRAAALPVSVRDGGEKDHLAALAWLDRSLRQDRPDLIWTSLTRATLLGQQVGAGLGVPVVSWQHAAYLKPANEILLRTLQGRTALWVADSQGVAEFASRRLQVPEARLAVWPIFRADPQAIQADPSRPGPLRIGSLGRLHRVKGYDVLIAALARLKAYGLADLPPFEVLIAGDGAERDALQAQIDAARLDNVRLVGFAENPRAFLADLHLYIQPSRSEGLCVAAHEAMQAGLPVIASAVGELPHSIAHGRTGLLVCPEDPVGLAGALSHYLSRPETLKEDGQGGRQRTLESFGPEAFARAGAAVLARLGVGEARAA